MTAADGVSELSDALDVLYRLHLRATALVDQMLVLQDDQFKMHRLIVDAEERLKVLLTRYPGSAEFRHL